MKNKILLHSLVIIGATHLPSCSSLPPGAIDPNFASHDVAALASPHSNVIVGMWYNHHQSGSQSVSATKLFNSDGTGLARVRLRGFESDLGTTDQNFPLTWKYDGNGWWTAIETSAGGYPNQLVRYRTDGKVLLSYSDLSGIRVHKVWVRADDARAVSTERQQPQTYPRQTLE